MVRGDTAHRLVGEFPSVIEFLLGDELADFGKMLKRARMIVIVRRSRPEGILVELDAFLGHPAENHPAESSIAERHRFGPSAGWLPIPERPDGILRWRCLAGEPRRIRPVA